MVPFLIASMRSITARESETLGSLNPVIRVDLPARSSCKHIQAGRPLYVSPSWSDYLNVECVSIIQKLFNKSVK